MPTNILLIFLLILNIKSETWLPEVTDHDKYEESGYAGKKGNQ